MKVPLLDLKAQLEYLEDDLLQAVSRVVHSTRYIQGPEVEKLEEEIAGYCGTEYGIGVSSGTDALLVSLMSLGIGRGDRVLTTPYSFFATMGVVLRLGAEPVFADIDLESYNIDVEGMAEVLEADKARSIKAIIPVHLYGQCAEMTAVKGLAEQYHLPIIEDAAQAIGAEYPLRKDGTLHYARAGSMGLCGCFSFFPSKNLGCLGDGGMVVTSDKEFAEKIILMRNHGAYPKYYHEMVGGNFRLDPIQAAALTVKLPYLPSWHKKRRHNAHVFNRLFQDSGLVDSGKVILPVEVYQASAEGAESNVHIYNQYVLRVERRDELRDWLQKNEIGCEIYYPVPLHKQRCLGEIAKGLSLPNAEKAADETIALPIYPELTGEMQEYVVEKIAQFYS
ncbi:MAG: transcriptional regulator [Deltaproteobacteria bacterium]|nr:MAG: transcriptional regulator [Deltaproteobacteria bacterium]PIE73588.1 MAG: transcriptional regulator [Deltaproteobacteria bacterium]